MNGQQSILIFFLGLVLCSLNCTSASVLEVTFRPGENITLYCDCKAATGVFIVWFFRSCSHENQTPLVITAMDQIKPWKKNSRLKFVKNDSSESHDLIIINATNSDVGFYYCGTEAVKVEKDEDKNIVRKDIYTYGNITTRLMLNTCRPCSDFKTTVEDCDGCWKLLFSLCPTVFLLSVLFSLLFYLLCHNTGKENQDDRNLPEQKRHMGETQDENICYAALEIHQPSKRTKKKRVIQSSDYKTHTTVKYAHNEDSYSPWK